MQANQHRSAFRAANRPLRPPFAGTRGDFLGCPYPSKGAMLAVRLAEIRRKSVKIPGTNRALFTKRLGEPE